ncbi:hypothetical protein [Halorubrum vacuolatum]|nr:hypothetical protein [Halorubrum vacuolatum]
MNIDHHKFSLKYVEIIEDVLHLGESESIRPVPEARVEELSRRLYTHFSVWQRGALNSLRNSDQNIVFHFGNSDRLTETLEYSPLYADHVVLQDLIFRQLQTRTTPAKKLMRIKPVINEIIKWKPLIEEGRVSIVPSPRYWDDQIEEHHMGLGPQERLFASPLYASVLLDCQPLTDVPTIERKLPKLAKSSMGEEIAKISVDQNAVSTEEIFEDEEFYRNTLSEFENNQVFDLLPNLIGSSPKNSNPELWCLKDPDPEQLSELSEDIHGFREWIHETIREIEEVDDASEIHEIVEVASEQAQKEYVTIHQERVEYRDQLGKQSIRVVFQSIPIVVGVTHQDILISMLSSTAGAGLTGIELYDLIKKWREGPSESHNSVFRVFNFFDKN